MIDFRYFEVFYGYRVGFCFDYQGNDSILGIFCAFSRKLLGWVARVRTGEVALPAGVDVVVGI